MTAKGMRGFDERMTGCDAAIARCGMFAVMAKSEKRRLRQSRQSATPEKNARIWMSGRPLAARRSK
jgi:hypothetical protein